MKSIELYVAGSATGNTIGPGAYCAIMTYQSHQKKFYAGYDQTFTTRMELRGILAGITALKQPCEVNVYLNNQLIIDAFEKDWVSTWQKKGYFSKPSSKIKHTDLYRKIYAALGDHVVVFKHSSDAPDFDTMNHCKNLAKKIKKEGNLILDEKDDSDLGLEINFDKLT